MIMTGCGSGITEGEVYDKEHRDESTQYMLMPITTSDGETSNTIYVPFFITHPETWIISIKAYNEENREYDRQTYYVSQEVFDSVNIGDWYVYENGDGTTEEPVIKKRVEDDQVKEE
jgi:hypothetical protein